MSRTANSLLTAVTATGAGAGSTASSGLDKVIKDHTIQATITGAPTAVTVDLEGSLDGTTWFILDSHVFTAGELTATAAIVHILGAPVRHIRGNLTVLTGGTAPTVTMLYDGHE